MNHEDLTCVFEGLDNKGRIYLSGVQTASNYNLLRKHHIGAVLTVAKDIVLPDIKNHVTFYLHLYAHDIQSQNIINLFDKSYNFIQNSRKQTNILIHCIAGISRSPTIVASYLIRKYGQSVQRVIKHLQRKRVKVNPNKGFISQLIKYSLELKSKDKSLSKNKQIRNDSVNNNKQMRDNSAHSKNNNTKSNHKKSENLIKMIQIVDDYPQSPKPATKILLKPSFKENLIQNLNENINQDYVDKSPLLLKQSANQSKSKSINSKIDKMKISMFSFAPMKESLFQDNNNNACIKYINQIKKDFKEEQRIYSPKKYRNRPLSVKANYQE